MDKARNPDANENAASESAKSVQRLVSVHAIVYIQRATTLDQPHSFGLANCLVRRDGTGCMTFASDPPHSLLRRSPR
jgi:hypothetical protein